MNDELKALAFQEQNDKRAVKELKDRVEEMNDRITELEKKLEKKMKDLNMKLDDTCKTVVDFMKTCNDICDSINNRMTRSSDGDAQKLQGTLQGTSNEAIVSQSFSETNFTDLLDPM